MEKSKIIINGKTILAKSNQTILQACEKVGLYIPRFCYNEALSIAGNCRMCLVEIEKSPKLMPACAIKITNEMKINTKSNLVKKTRESILEFLLINHPLDCPICDQGGECDLQDQALVYGSDRGRFYEYKRSVQDKNAGPLIKTIMTRCIHCTRCIRYATEIAGIEVYGTTGRGKSMEVGTYIGKIFNSEISGNVIDLCPVGALTSKPYAFTVRPWELTSVETIDILDGIGSNVRMDVKGTEIMRILPKANNKTYQKQWISDKTRFAYDGLKNQRIYYPIIKEKEEKNIQTGQEKEKWVGTITSWTKAIEQVVKEIEERKKRGETIESIIGNFVDQESIITKKKIINQLGGNKLYIEQTLGKITKETKSNYDWRNRYITKIEIEKEGEGRNQKEKNEIKASDLIMLVGTNPRYEASMFNVSIRQIMLKTKEKKNVIYFGGPLNLTYEAKEVNQSQKGNTIEGIYLINQGKTKNTKKIIKANKPIGIVSYYTMQRADGKGISEMLDKIFNMWNKIKEKEKNQTKRNKHKIANMGKENKENKNEEEKEKQTWHILHTNTAIPGALDLGYGTWNREEETSQMQSCVSEEKKSKLIYILGADIEEKKIEQLNEIKNKNQTKIIYQGHHGCNAAKIADIILPSKAYIEKKGTYVNTQGIVQETQIVYNTEKEIYEDWKILQNIANELKIQGIKTERKEKKEAEAKTEAEAEAALRFFQPTWKKKQGETENETKKLQKYINEWINNQIKEAEKEAEKTRIAGEKKKEEAAEEKRKNSTTNIQWNITHNFKKTFENIAPFLNNNQIETNTKAKELKEMQEKKYHKIYKSHIIYDRDNFYLTDIITKASINMGKCSIMYKNKNFI